MMTPERKKYGKKQQGTDVRCSIPVTIISTKFSKDFED